MYLVLCASFWSLPIRYVLNFVKHVVLLSTLFWQALVLPCEQFCHEHCFAMHIVLSSTHFSLAQCSLKEVVLSCALFCKTPFLLWQLVWQTRYSDIHVLSKHVVLQIKSFRQALILPCILFFHANYSANLLST